MSSADTIYYFAYGEDLIADTLQESLRAAVSAATTPEDADAAPPPSVTPHALGYLEGSYRLALNAVSAASPRHGLANVEPLAAARPVEMAPRVGPALELPPVVEGPVAGRVYGRVYALPAAAEAALLEAVGQRGSYNVHARLPVVLVGAVNNKEEEGAEPSRLADVIVVAALDVAMFELKYEVSEEDARRLSETWRPLPPLQRLPGTPAGASAASALEGASGSGRRPGTHWANWVSSDRVVPSEAYLASLRKGFAESGLAGVVPPEYVAAYGSALVDGLRGRPEQEPSCVYLAYGSNLSWEQVCVRIGPPLRRRAVRLEGYELVPNKKPYSEKYASFGYYNIEACETRRAKEAQGLVPRPTTMPGYVCGAAYDITEEQLGWMDLYEGGYSRALLPCTDITAEVAAEKPSDALLVSVAAGAAGAAASDTDKTVQAWAYLAEDTEEGLLPSKEYVARVLEGEDILPAAYMDGIRATATNPLRSPRQNMRLRKQL